MLFRNANDSIAKLMISITSDIWDNVFKNGPSKICGRQAHGLRGLEIKETKINNRARAIEQIFVFDCCTKNEVFHQGFLQ